jgi:hypothetical protein
MLEMELCALYIYILFRHEEFLSHEQLQGMPNHDGKKTWWNGIGIFILSKSKINSIS